MNFIVFTLVLICAFAAFVSAGTYNGTVTGSNCGGNCPGGCDSCPCGTSTKYLDAASWCAKYSGWNQANCQCIMKAESGGNANAVNQNSQGGSYKWDVGLWQVNSFNWASCSGGNAPCDPQTNLNCAIKVFQWGGNTWKNWSTCGKCGCCGSK
eukprot:gene9107-10754_t